MIFFFKLPAFQRKSKHIKRKNIPKKIKYFDNKIDKVGNKIEILIDNVEKKIKRQQDIIMSCNLKIDELQNELHNIAKLRTKLNNDLDEDLTDNSAVV